MPELLVPADPLEAAGVQAGVKGIKADDVLKHCVFQVAEQQYDVGEVAHQSSLLR
ncbi:hypothetical protein [Streptomyces globisporus]|uniref:hypothetical protein n=1 Tax=Streptomyces globisporus TaxID=1908 RepID=UPI0037A0185D